MVLSFLGELKRRNVFRVAVAYLAGAWLLTEVSNTLFDIFNVSGAASRIVVVLLAIGFPIVLILSWVFEITPEGLMLEKDVQRQRSMTAQTGKTLDRIIIALLALALAYFAVDKFLVEPARVADIVAETTQQARSAALTESYGDNSIAVLPFVNMSSDPEQEYFSDGITEELLSLLSNVPELRVTARTSSFFFKGKDMPVAEIARALNVTHLLEGSVRRDGNRVRITAQLIEARSDTHLWSEDYDRTLDDIFAIQDEVAGKIASALVASFTGLHVRPAERTDKIAAFEAYRTGRLHWWRRSPAELRTALELFQEATEQDPNFAPAYAATADTLLLLSLYGDMPRPEAVDRARPMIEKALALDPESAEAFAAQGLARELIAQWDAAESALREAIRLKGDYIPARLWLGNMLGQQGRIPEQGLVLQEAMALDPLNELLAVNYAGNLYARGDYDTAHQLLSGLIAVKPDAATLLRILADMARAHGDLVGGWQYAARAYELHPQSPLVVGTLAQVWMELGDTDAAEKLLQEALQMARDNTRLQGQYFQLLLAEGRLEEAGRMIADQFGGDPGSLPDNFQRYSHLQTGLLRAVQRDLPAARDEFEQGIGLEESDAFSSDQVWALTMSACLNGRLGDRQRADQRLAQAERAVRRARVNGMDQADLYYAESAILAIKGQYDDALKTLRAAYDRGFRQDWVLGIDVRLDALRDRAEFLDLRQRIRDDMLRALAEVRSQQTL